MFVGTLAIAGIPPLSGFFSKDEILYRAFLSSKPIWALAVVTALMTAFYMFRLVAMTFFGAYRGPAWETAQAHAGGGHGAAHAADPHAHGQAPGAHDTHDAHGGHGHGPWHGPHESPTAMTFPLMALAVGALVAGFFGVPAALGGGNAIEHFLEPSFTAHEAAAATEGAAVPEAAAAAEGAAAGATEAEAEHAEEGSHAVELGLMVFSVLIAAIGISLAWRFYVTQPEISSQLAERFAGAHRLLSHKYYVDELYGATIIAATWLSARGLWTVDRNVVDGVVNGTGRLTLVGSFFSAFTDRTFVDGIVNLVGRVIQEGSHVFRRLQTGLVQNYALLMLFGIFVFVSVYLFMR
jgi:NADH-quinone oxidoreductase subunit L